MHFKNKLFENVQRKNVVNDMLIKNKDNRIIGATRSWLQMAINGSKEKQLLDSSRYPDFCSLVLLAYPSKALYVSGCNDYSIVRVFLYPTTIQELLGNLLMLISYILFITTSIYHHHHHHLNSLHGIANKNKTDHNH